MNITFGNHNDEYIVRWNDNENGEIIPNVVKASDSISFTGFSVRDVITNIIRLPIIKYCMEFADGVKYGKIIMKLAEGKELNLSQKMAVINGLYAVEDRLRKQEIGEIELVSDGEKYFIDSLFDCMGISVNKREEAITNYKDFKKDAVWVSINTLDQMIGIANKYIKYY